MRRLEFEGNFLGGGRGQVLQLHQAAVQLARAGNERDFEALAVGILQLLTQLFGVGKQFDADALVVPRALEAVRNIPVTELDGVKTAGDVYWRSVWHSLQKAFEGQDDHIFRWEGDELHLERALWLFALLGFEMTKQRLFNGVSAGKPFDDFVQRLWSARESLLVAQGITSLPRLQKWLESLDADDLGKYKM